MNFVQTTYHEKVAAPLRPSLTKQRVRLALYVGLVLVDCAAIRAGFTLGVSLRGEGWLAPNGVELGWLILPLHLIFAARNGGYGRVALESRTESIRRACGAFLGATAAIALLIFFQYAGVLVSRLAFGVAIAASIVFLMVGRLFFITCCVAIRRDGMMGELVIVDGAPRPGRRGKVFDAAAAGIHPDLRDPEVLSRVAEVVAPYDRVVVATTPDRRHDWAMLLKAYNITGELLLEEAPLGGIGLDRYAGNDTLVVARGPMSLANRLQKRAIDTILSFLALVFLAPLMLVVALAIKLDTPGPVFFAQERMGRGNKRFRILKFRSMRVEATDHSGNRSASRDDDRITRVGRLIRATSIDELPQVLNVLMGQMSVVGPRPHALGSLAGDQLFWEVNHRYWLRHTLKPGITGLAQIRGFRGATHERIDLENRLQADLEYIEGWGMWRDIAIIFSTIRVIVHPKAY